MTQNLTIQRWNSDRTPDVSELQSRLRQEGFTGIHIFRDSPGASYPNHQHSYVEVRWLVEGEVTFGVGKQEYTLKPGDRLDMPENTVHNAKMHPQKGAVYVCASK